MISLSIMVYDMAGQAVFDKRLGNFDNLRFTTQYPGGLYGSCQFDLSLDPSTQIFLRGGYTLQIYEGLELVWEGILDDLEDNYQPTQKGLSLTATGYWGAWLGRRLLDKRWCDARITEHIWVWNEAATGAEKCTLDRYNRINFVPKGVAWTSGQYAAVRYTMPIGQTVKRITYSYDLQEAAQAWELSCHRSTDGTSFTAMTNVSGETYAAGTTTVITASGTGNIDVTLATPSRYLELRFYARANQTPTEDGTYYAKFTNIKAYSEAGSINLTEIVADVQSVVPELSSDTNHISSNSQTLEFVTNGPELLNSILSRAANFGDTSQNQWAVGVTSSRRTSDKKPALFAEQVPPLTEYDYFISASEAQLHHLRRNTGAVWNYILIQYEDMRGFPQVLTPDDSSDLADQDSISLYGRKEKIIYLRQTDASLAYKYALAFLKKYKQPVYSVTQPLVVRQVYAGSGKGLVIPAVRIQAGKRLKITDYLHDQSGDGLTVMISATNYEHNSRRATLTVGVPDDLAIMLTKKSVNYA